VAVKSELDARKFLRGGAEEFLAFRGGLCAYMGGRSLAGDPGHLVALDIAQHCTLILEQHGSRDDPA